MDLSKCKKELVDDILKILSGQKVKITSVDQFRNIEDILRSLYIKFSRLSSYIIPYPIYQELVFHNLLQEEDYKCVDGPINRNGLKITPENILTVELVNKFKKLGYSVFYYSDIITHSKWFQFACNSIKYNLKNNHHDDWILEIDVTSEMSRNGIITYYNLSFHHGLYIISVNDPNIAYLWKDTIE